LCSCPGEGANCVNGVCACPDALPDTCDGVCVDTNSDPNNCGACGVGYVHKATSFDVHPLHMRSNLPERLALTCTSCLRITGFNPKKLVEITAKQRNTWQICSISGSSRLSSIFIFTCWKVTCNECSCGFVYIQIGVLQQLAAVPLNAFENQSSFTGMLFVFRIPCRSCRTFSQRSIASFVGHDVACPCMQLSTRNLLLERHLFLLG
jgi:hypothetical protein